MPEFSLRRAPLFALAIGLLLCLICGLAAHAQDSAAGAGSQDETNKQLLQRISELEAKVKQLEEKEASPPPAAAPAPAPAPEPEPVVEQPPVNAVADRLKLLLFGDTGYQIGHYYGPTSTFELGEFDMFATARLTDRVSVLGEVLYTFGEDNFISVDLERLPERLFRRLDRAHSYGHRLLQHGL
jgi:hypothetical protein